MPFNIVISSLFLSLILYLFVIVNGAFFEPIIYPLIDRVVYSTNFVDDFFANGSVGQTILILSLVGWVLFSIQNKLKYFISSLLIFLLGIGNFLSVPGIIVLLSIISFPTIIILVSLGRFVKTKYISFNGNLTMNYIGISGIILSVISISITYINLSYPEISLPPINYLYYLYLLSSLFSPLILFIIILAIPVKFLLSRFHTSSKFRIEEQPKRHSIYPSDPTRYWYIYLISIIIASLIISMIPQLLIVNPDNQLIGADTGDYARLIESIRDNSSSSLSTERLLEQFSEDRVFSILVFFAYSEIMNYKETAEELDYLPLILGPGLILSIFMMTRELTSNYTVSLFSSFLTMVSFHLLIGIYSGFYANWLSLIIGYLSIYFLLRFIRNPKKISLILFSVLMILVLLTHSSNWTILLLVLIVFITVLIILPNQKKRRTILLACFALIPSISIDILKLLLIKFSGLIGDINFAEGRVTSSPEISSIWINLIDTYNIQLGGIFGNSIIFVLVLYWLYRENFKSNPNMMIITIFIILPIFPILFAETEIQSRILYIIPFQIPAAIGLFQLKCKFGYLVTISVCLSLLAIALRLVSNFHFEPIDI